MTGVSVASDERWRSWNGRCSRVRNAWRGTWIVVLQWADVVLDKNRSFSRVLVLDQCCTGETGARLGAELMAMTAQRAGLD